MEKRNFIYSGRRIKGLPMLILSLLLLVGGFTAIIFGALMLDDESRKLCGGLLLGGGITTVIATFILLSGLRVIRPNDARALLFFGEYRGNLLDTGYWWLNPFIRSEPISLRAHSLNVEPIKVNDKAGNPIMIGLVLVWRVRADEIYRAVFDIDATAMANPEGKIPPSAAERRMKVIENFVRVQSDAALRQVAGCYAYDTAGTESEELTLHSDSADINALLEAKLSERVKIAGVEILEARINYLAYAPEIAAVMLRRQQADAIISAREKIVDGAVSMVKMALDKLSDEEIVELDDDKKAAMVSNLLVVLCADEAAQPVLNTGTLHH